MTTLDSSHRDIRRSIRNPHGLTLQIGPFSVRVHSDIEDVALGIANLYSDYSMSEAVGFADFHVALNPPAGLRRWYQPQVNFYFDGHRPFKPLTYNQAFAFFEWGLNWCISTNVHHFLIVHAAVVEKAGMALILPGAPGAGKSTLCSGLVSRGWRFDFVGNWHPIVASERDANTVPRNRYFTAFPGCPIS